MENRLSAGDCAEGGARLEFDLRGGEYHVFAGEGALFSRARVRVLARLKRSVARLDSDAPWARVEEPADGARRLPASLVLCKDQEWGKVLFEAGAAGGALLLRAGIRWDGEGEPPRLEALVPMLVRPPGVWEGRGSSRDWRAYVHGWQCWTPSGVVKGARPGDWLLPLFLPGKLKPMLANPSTPVTSERGLFYSEWFSALGDLDRGDSAVVGFVGVSRMLSRVMVRIGRRPEHSELEARALLDGVAPGRGRTIWSETLAVVPGDLSGRNLEEYAELLARGQGVEAVRGTPPGWCSWYQYFTGVDQASVLENLEELSGEYRGLGIDVLQVDDGYAPAPGDWLEAGGGFPDGMESLARRISSRGKVPGIWVAPFTVTRRSRTFKERNGWLQRGEKGRPVLAGINPDWGGRFYGLDVTHPEVLAWLREVFSTLAGYGYRFFKLDFMACGLLEGPRHDPGLTRAEAARRALEVIRDAVGPEAFVIGAGGPVLLGTGVLDAQRVSGDVAPFWRAARQTLLRDRATPGVRNSLTNAMTRAFMSGRLFEGDPDCLMARLSGTRLTEPERETLASAIAVFGGSIMVSDDLGGWGGEELAMAGRSFPHAHGLPRAPDLWKNEVPELLLSEMSDPLGPYCLLLAVNWLGKPRGREVRLADLGLAGRWHACEYWSGRYLGETDDAVRLPRMEPHGCALVRLTEASGAPRLIGSSVNLSQGVAELAGASRDGSKFGLELSSPVECEAVVTVSLPGAGGVSGTLRKGGGVDVEKLAAGVYRAGFALRGGDELSLAYT